MNNKRLLSMLFSVAALQACGGGGDDDTTAGSGTGAVAKSPIGVALQKGLYSVSYGSEKLYGKDDKSIWKTTLKEQADGSQDLDVVNYAGNDQAGNFALEATAWGFYDPSSVIQDEVEQIRLDDKAGTIVATHKSSTGTKKSYVWKIDVVPTNLARSSMQQFLLETKSRTKAIAGLSINGLFPADSQGFKISYYADDVRFFFGRIDSVFSSQTDFEKSYICGSTSTVPGVGYRGMPGGSLLIYEIGAQTDCIMAIQAGRLIGTGSWSRKQATGFEYIDIAFPSTVSYARLDPTFSEQDYANGLHPVKMIPPKGPWVNGYVIPPRVRFQARNIALNLRAAEAIKAAAPM